MTEVVFQVIPAIFEHIIVFVLELPTRPTGCSQIVDCVSGDTVIGHPVVELQDFARPFMRNRDFQPVPIRLISVLLSWFVRSSCSSHVSKSRRFTVHSSMTAPSMNSFVYFRVLLFIVSPIIQVSSFLESIQKRVVSLRSTRNHVSPECIFCR
jgi:hypothetical protein